MPSPPSATRRPHPITAHGHTRVDDFYWLRERENPEVIAYLEAEHRYAAERTAHTAVLQEQIFQELRASMQETDETAPVRLGTQQYFTRTEAGAQYPIHCRREPAGVSEALLDENVLAADRPFFSLGSLRVSPNERLLAYTVAATGGEVFELFVKDLETGMLIDGPLHGVSPEVEWVADSRTLFYVTYTASWRSYRAFRHALGQPQGDDALVYEEADTSLFLHIRRGRSGKYLVLESASAQTATARVVPLDRPDMAPELVTPVRSGVNYRVQHGGGRFYIHTNDSGTGYRLVSAPEDDPAEEHWETVAPEVEGVSQEGFDVFAGHLALYESVDGLVRLRTIDLASGAERTAAFPDPAYSVVWWPTGVWPLNPAFASRTLRVVYSSLVTPAQTLDYDMDSGALTLVKQTAQPGYDPSRHVVERLWAVAEDGVRVPISLVRRHDMPPGEARPCLLTGYGAYGSSFEPAFQARWLPLLERGFVCAIAHVRGGGDLGEAWYRGGRAHTKRTTFTDFIACAEHLAAQGYTTPALLAVSGRSAGGLLIGAVVTMRPELFRAALAIVPFVDVVTTSLDPSIPLVEAEYEEWGDPRDAEQYRFMLTYSPYDNLAARAYPAILATAGLYDPRVQYWEPAKFVARLRTLKTDDRALLLKTEMSGGHRGPSGRYDHLRETAFEWAFVLDALGLAS